MRNTENLWLPTTLISSYYMLANIKPQTFYVSTELLKFFLSFQPRFYFAVNFTAESCKRTPARVVDREVWVQAPAGVIVLCSWTRHLTTFTMPLSTQ